MRTVKRLYLYAVAIISLEVVLWGMIGLVRSIFAGQSLGGDVLRLAGALALILVGVPVFLIHWWLAQRGVAQDDDERSSAVRAVFLYAVLLGTLIPGTQNILAFINRSLLPIFQAPARMGLFGGQQTLGDNLIAVFMNILIAAYFLQILRGDWKAVEAKDALRLGRRVFCYIWVIYGLAMVVGGIQQILYYLFQLTGNFDGLAMTTPSFHASAANGLALLLVGVPLWVLAWKNAQDSISEPDERASLLRLGVLYLLALAGVITVLTSGGLVIDLLLRLLLGEHFTARNFLIELRSPLSIGFPLAGVWAYYGYWLNRTIKDVPDAPRRAGMRRLYYYILAALGLSATLIGLNMLLNFFTDLLLRSGSWYNFLRDQLAAALATLAAGLPLWILTWWPMQTEALSAGDAGDHARRSLVRKIYLYLALFAGVIGGMVSAGVLVYNLLRAVLGNPPSGLAELVLDSSRNLVLFALLGIYHGLTLGVDGRREAGALMARHAAFPVLVFDPGNGTFGRDLLAAIGKQAPSLPASVQLADRPVPKETAPQAIVLPGDLALNPPAALGRWLARYDGHRIVVPRAAPGWIWPGGTKESVSVALAAQAIRQLAEGQEIHRASGTGGAGWLVLLYILASVCGLQVLIALISAGTSLFGY